MRESKITRILIVDDHPVVREGMKKIIEREKDMTVCGEAEDATQAMSAIENLKPSMAIVDISLEGRSGIDLIKDIRARHGDLPILVLSVHAEATYAERAIRVGAQGYVMKGEAPKSVVAAIRKILGGDIYVSDKMATKLLTRVIGRRSDVPEDSSIACLGDRELEVFHMIGHGYGTSKIAEEMGVSVSTIETHRANIKRKLDLKDSAELARFAAEWVLSQR